MKIRTSSLALGMAFGSHFPQPNATPSQRHPSSSHPTGPGRHPIPSHPLDGMGMGGDDGPSLGPLSPSLELATSSQRWDDVRKVAVRMGRRAGKSAERQAWQALQAVRDITRPRELVALGMRDSVAQALLSSPVGLVRSEQGKSAIAEAIENEMLGAQRLLNEMLYGVPDPNAMVELSAGTWETLENGNYAANPGGSTIHYSTPWTAESAVESALKKIFDTTPYPTPDVVAWAGELFDEAYSLAGITQKPRLPLPSPEERAEARDPTTPAARLEELAATRRGLLNLVARNPNVSDRLMRRWLSGGPIEAWLNPTTPMLLWEVDSEVWRGWARRALAMAAGARGKLLGSTLEQGIDLAREALWREPLDLRHRVVEAIARLVTPQARAGEGEGG